MHDGDLITLPVPTAVDPGGVMETRCDGMASVRFDPGGGAAKVTFYARKGTRNVVVARLTMPRLALLQALARICIVNAAH